MDRDRLLKVLEEFFGFSEDWQDGTYFYNLTRVKEAFGLGTMTIDDFEEMEYSQIEELVDNIIEEFKVKESIYE